MRVCVLYRSSLQVKCTADFSVCSDILKAETLEMAVINAVWCLVSDIMFILECLEWNSGLHLQYADSGD